MDNTAAIIIDICPCSIMSVASSVLVVLLFALISMLKDLSYFFRKFSPSFLPRRRRIGGIVCVVVVVVSSRRIIRIRSTGIHRVFFKYNSIPSSSSSGRGSSTRRVGSLLLLFLLLPCVPFGFGGRLLGHFGNILIEPGRFEKIPYLARG